MIRDLCGATLAVGIALAYWRAADALPRSLLSDEVGADGLPKLLALALAACALALALRALIARRPASGPGLERHARALGVVGLGFVYVGLCPWLGYLPSLAALIAASAVYFGARAAWTVAATAAGTAIALWLIFAKALGVAMPGAALARWLT
jgi:putative tricarboxylic transport membrane protein